MPAGIPPVPLQTEQEESGEDERVQRAGEGTVWLPRRATGEGVAGLLRAECTREGVHTEIFSLKAELAKALTCRCMRENCDRRLAVDGTAAV